MFLEDKITHVKGDTIKVARKKSALKKARQTEVKTQRNKSANSKVQNLIKKFKAAINANEASKAEELLPKLFKEVDSACAAGILHRNNADRKKADAAKLLDDLKAGRIVIVAKVDARTKAAEKRAKEAEQKAQVKKANEENKAKRLADKESALKAQEKAEKKTTKKAEKTEKAEKPVKTVKKTTKAEKVEKAENEEKVEEAKEE